MPTWPRTGVRYAPMTAPEASPDPNFAPEEASRYSDVVPSSRFAELDALEATEEKFLLDGRGVHQDAY